LEDTEDLRERKLGKERIHERKRARGKYGGPKRIRSL